MDNVDQQFNTPSTIANVSMVITHTNLYLQDIKMG